VGHWFLPTCVTAKGERQLDDKVKPLPLFKAGTAYEWTFVYDPDANAGEGQLRVTLGDQSATLNLRPGVKATGGGQVKFDLDDLRYTVAAADSRP
jgi:hypothetical protein